MIGLYIHIPFCMKKCKYCDFNSFCFTESDKKNYLLALSNEMEKYKGASCDTVFVGGGTPTSLNLEELSFLLSKINENFILSEACEFTVEANPKTLNREKLELMRRYGVTRLSVGVQSFNDNELLKLGRVHTAGEAEETILLCKKYGFDNINIDIMSAIPDQTIKSFEYNIEKAIDLNPAHISCYSLILEEGTPLYSEYKKGELNLPDEETERRIYELCYDMLEKSGYLQYEISNFAKKGFESKHNMKYWQCREYIGLGLSAHSYMGGVRFSNTDSFSSYINGEYLKKEREILTSEDKMSEFMFMGLRMTKGVSEEEFYKRFGIEMKQVFEKPLSKFIKMGMIEEENGFLRLSHNALSVSNQIMCEFII